MIELKAGIEIVKVDDGKVLLDANRGVYWHLNDTAITLLEELRGGRSLDDIVYATARSA